MATPNKSHHWRTHVPDKVISTKVTYFNSGQEPNYTGAFVMYYVYGSGWFVQQLLSGLFGFPGGSRDFSDKRAWDTEAREFKEESYDAHYPYQTHDSPPHEAESGVYRFSCSVVLENQYGIRKTTVSIFHVIFIDPSKLGNYKFPNGWISNNEVQWVGFISNSDLLARIFPGKNVRSNFRGFILRACQQIMPTLFSIAADKF
jgi:hypothetical protein